MSLNNRFSISVMVCLTMLSISLHTWLIFVFKKYTHRLFNNRSRVHLSLSLLLFSYDKSNLLYSPSSSLPLCTCPCFAWSSPSTSQLLPLFTAMADRVRLISSLKRGFDFLIMLKKTQNVNVPQDLDRKLSLIIP